MRSGARLSTPARMAAAGSQARVSSCSHVRRRAGNPALLSAVGRGSFALGFVGVGRLLESVAYRFGAASSRPAPTGQRGDTISCPLSPPTAEGAGTLRPRPPLLRVSCMPRVVCLLPPSACAPLPRGRGAGGLVFKGWVCSRDVQPSNASPRGFFAAGNRREKSEVRRKAVAPRGLVGTKELGSDTNTQLFLAFRAAACGVLPAFGAGSAPQLEVIPPLEGGEAVVLWGFIRHRSSGRAPLVCTRTARGVADVLKISQFFNILLKICIFAPETSDA